ncbi:hypothetical protein RAB80_017306 [Fusarium oxysporum f. sp. vasinfectum]|nr:hypothetical protein RAB80_017306 [Fusarium oxysporum f. sp. vasinfectum]
MVVYVGPAGEVGHLTGSIKGPKGSAIKGWSKKPTDEEPH